MSRASGFGAGTDHAASSLTWPSTTRSKYSVRPFHGQVDAVGLRLRYSRGDRVRREVVAALDHDRVRGLRDHRAVPGGLHVGPSGARARDRGVVPYNATLAGGIPRAVSRSDRGCGRAPCLGTRVGVSAMSRRGVVVAAVVARREIVAEPEVVWTHRRGRRSLAPHPHVPRVAPAPRGHRAGARGPLARDPAHSRGHRDLRRHRHRRSARCRIHAERRLRGRDGHHRVSAQAVLAGHPP